MANVVTANMAWKAAQDWDRHPLTKGQIEKQGEQRQTRQITRPTLPPQSVHKGTSLVPRLVEIWEKLPKDIKDNFVKDESSEKKVKSKFNKWASDIFSLKIFINATKAS